MCVYEKEYGENVEEREREGTVALGAAGCDVRPNGVVDRD